MQDSTSIPPELLLEQVAWLRRLAHRLVADVHLAEDLAQETVAIALGRLRTGHEGRLQAWLARVLRNLAREQRRSEGHRRAREERRDGATTAPPTDELLARVQTERRLAAALLELEEPFRRTLLLRFHGDLPPREIARREGVPVATVKSRLHRGLARLRNELDQEFEGGRNAWVLAMIPLAKANPLPAASLGGLLLNAKLLVAACVVLLSGLLYVIQEPGEGPARGATAPLAAPAQLVAAQPEEEPASEPRRVPELVAADRPAATRGELAVSATPGDAPRVTGTAFDAEGAPLAGMALRQLGSTASLGRTDGAGRFEFTAPAETLRLELAEDGWVTVRPGFWSRGTELEPVVVAAPSIELAGRVENAAGQPLPDAGVELVLPANFEARFRSVLDSGTSAAWPAVLDGVGGFRLASAPAVRGATLRATCEGFEALHVDAPTRSTPNLRLRLYATAERAAARLLRGQVVRADGEPAVAARVALGFVSVPTDPDGRFVLDLGRAVQTDELVAVEAGSRPGRLERPGTPAVAGDALDGWPDWVEVRLGGPSLTLAGRVVDADGEPAPDHLVWVRDPTPFGSVGIYPLRMEGLMAGRPLPSRAVPSLAELPDADGARLFSSATPAEEPNALWSYVRTDAAGRFELEGLEDRTYELAVMEAELHGGTVTGPLQAGRRDVEIRLPDDGTHPRVKGHVLTRHGDPVAGVRVLPWIPVVDVEARVFGGVSDITRFWTGTAVTTDAEGAFVLEDVPREHVQFHLVSDEILPGYASVDEIEDPDAFVLRVAARAHLEVLLQRRTDVTGIRVRDENGAPLHLYLMRADGYSNDTELPIVQGTSGVVSVTSEAAYLDLLVGSTVVDTRSLVLHPGQRLELVY